jgi:hypothetical protein
MRVYPISYSTESDGGVTHMRGAVAVTISLLLLVTQFAILTIPVIINGLLKPQKFRIPTGQEKFSSLNSPMALAEAPSSSSVVTMVFSGAEGWGG